MTAAFYFSETYLRVPAVSISCVKRVFCREYAFRLLFPLLPLTQYPCFLPFSYRLPTIRLQPYSSAFSCAMLYTKKAFVDLTYRKQKGNMYERISELH